MSYLTFHCFDGAAPRSFYSSQPFGAWDRLVEWLTGHCDDEADRYQLVEMFDADENSIEVVTFDGEPIGVLDKPSIGKDDLARFETYEQMKLRESAEDAARELNADVNRELRIAAE
jgi:hypothetical protein